LRRDVKMIRDNKLEQENRITKWIYHTIPFAVLFLSWEILARVIHQPYILPPFSAVAASALSLSLADDLASTLGFSLLGLLIILLAGLPLGSIIQRSNKAKWTLDPFFWYLLFAIGIGTTSLVPILILMFGLTQLTLLIQSIIVPILVVSLISGYGSMHLAIRLGFLMCLSFRFMGEMIFGTTIMGMGYQFSMFCNLHNVEMMYAIMLLMGFSGLFIDRVLLKYAGNLIQKKGSDCLGKSEI